MSDGQSHQEGRPEEYQLYSPNQSSLRKILTPAELGVLKECSRESFMYRSVPLATALILVTQVLTNRGILKPHPRFGALFKNLGAGLVGFVVGKVSYQGECRQKMMNLPNSPLAEAMMQGKRGRELFENVVESRRPQGPDIQYIDTGSSKDASALNNDEHRDTDIDSDINSYRSGLDDRLRPSVDTLDSDLKRQGEQSRQANPIEPATDYSELRKRNREQQQNQDKTASTQQEKTALDRKLARQQQRMKEEAMMRRESSGTPQGGSRRNQFGDIIED